MIYLFKNQNKKIIGETPGFVAKASMGITAGALGAFCGTPADVALIRMCVDNRLPEAERRNYRSVLDAWARIAKVPLILIFECVTSPH